MGMKIRKYIVLMLCLVLFCGCSSSGSSSTKEASEQTENQKEPFHYEHDPTKNPEAMIDIVVDPNAVYGFSPNPESERLASFADFDWSNKAFVAFVKEVRRRYHESMESMMDMVYEMRDEGETTEEIARAVVAERNRLRYEANKDSPEILEKMKQRNLETYGQEEGPNPEQLYEEYGSWAKVIQMAFAPNMGMDAVCGLYDDNYPLYIELGLVEDDSVENDLTEND